MEPSGVNRTSSAPEVNPIVSSTTSFSTLSSGSSVPSASVPTTVITSSKSTCILPFPFRHDPSPTPLHHMSSTNPNSQQTVNPNLVSLLSGSCDTPQQPTSIVSNTSPPHSNSLHSILLAKDSPSSTPSSDQLSSATPSQTPLNNSKDGTQQSHSFLTEKCHSFFLSGGIQPSSGTFLSACPTQSNALAPKSSNHGNCMIYKGYKKLCNAQSLFKCKSSSNSHNSSESVPAATFNPNHPFGQPLSDNNNGNNAASASTTSSTSSTSTCILSDLLRGGCNKSPNKKNLPFSESTAENIPNNTSKSTCDRAPAAHATTMANILAASLDDDDPGKGASAKECTLTYYSQMLKNRIKKLYHDSDSTSTATTSEKADKMTGFKQPEELLLPPGLHNMSAESGTSVANHSRKTVISKLGVYPQSLNLGGDFSCSNRMFSIPLSKSFLSGNIESMQTSPPIHISHTSVNSYLDTLIRSNVISEQAEQQSQEDSAQTPVMGDGSVLCGKSIASASIPVTSLDSAVITTAADINPNKPHHFVNLIDKIISNVFTVTTSSKATSSTSNQCFLSPTASTSTTNSSQSQVPTCSLSSEMTVQCSQSPATSVLPSVEANNVFLGSQKMTKVVPTPGRASNVSAICQLLNSNSSPPTSPVTEAETAATASSSTSSNASKVAQLPTPATGATQSVDCLNDISDKVYQQLIEFEFNHESILKKFQSIPNCDSSFSHTTGRPGLNVNEKARIEELEKVLYPLQFCLSSMCGQRAEMKKNLHKSFFEKNANVSVDFQRQTLLATTEQAINLLIELTKQLDSFAELSSADQMNLLRTSVMEIMLMRSILIMPQRLKERITNRLKRCLDENGTASCSDVCAGAQAESPATPSTQSAAAASVEASASMKEHCRKIHQNLNHPGKLISYYMTKMNKSPFADDDMLECPERDTEPCTNHPHDRPFGIDLTSASRLDEFMCTNDEQEFVDESSHDSFSTDDTSFSNLGSLNGENIAADYAKQFRAHYLKLARSIDKDWYEDRTIFYLLFAILLFRPTKTKIDSIDKVREEHLTYVYLLKRYLENKFKSYCTARSHFIRIFDRLEELQKMNDQVIQKLLDFDLVCAQNLLEKLCIC